MVDVNGEGYLRYDGCVYIIFGYGSLTIEIPSHSLLQSSKRIHSRLWCAALSSSEGLFISAFLIFVVWGWW